MNNNQAMVGCALGSWMVGALAGALAMILLMLLGGWGFMQGAFAGAVVFAISGLLVSVVMCRPLPALVQKPEPKSAAPAPALFAAQTTDVAVSAPTDVKPSAALPGQAELATRKGEWKYEAEAPAPAKTPKKPAAKKTAKKADPAPVAAVDGPGTKPEMLSAARDSGPDNLKQIKGVGPKLESLLHTMGFYHFDQIAAWGAQEVAWVDQNLQGFKGRVSRDDWVAQAKILAEGGTTEFSSKVKKGGVY